jgi:hypothetical protein
MNTMVSASVRPATLESSVQIAIGSMFGWKIGVPSATQTGISLG